MNENQVSDELKTVSGTASNPPKPSSEENENNYDLGIIVATAVWWLPIIPMLQGQSPENAWLFIALGWIGVPAAVFLDGKKCGSLGGGLIYTVAGVYLPMISGLVYLHRRE